MRSALAGRGGDPGNIQFVRGGQGNESFRYEGGGSEGGSKNTNIHDRPPQPGGHYEQCFQWK